GFWIGAEILPWTILFMTILGIAAACGDEQIRRHAALFGLCLAAFTTALVPIALPVSEFSSRAVSWFSPAYAIFAALSGAVFVCEWALGRVSTSKLFRLAIASGLAGCAGAVFFFLVPSALNGAYADYDMYDATVALDNIDEARPLINALQLNRFIPVTIFASLANFIRLLAIPLAALGVCFFAAKKERETRTAWIVQTAFLTAAITLTVFWQIRVGKFMEVFAVVPLTYLLSLWNDRIKEKPQEIMVILAQMTVFLLLGPLAGSTQQTVKSLAMDPAAIAPIEQRSSCRLDSALPSLNDPETLGKSPLTIINIANAGPEILFRTPHKVLAGNFNVPGNEDAYNFFSSTKDTVALAIAKKWGAHLVLMCKKVPKFYFGKDFPKNASLVKGENGLLHFRNLGSYRTLVEKLIDNQAPDWLSPVETYGASDYLLYRIEYPKGYK
ncbi:MAG: hypothetical protein PHW76_09855, partial [Alphaproteobacteria bacterium]|nr:hypothetical protein [Alphaproteobacteria bacterium]